MDLISIRRKYKNIRNIIIVIFSIVYIVASIFIANEIYKHMIYDKIFISYSEQYEQASIKGKEILEKQKEEKKRKEKLPKLTEEGKNNLYNIYKSDKKRVFLTFDDGPSKTVTIPILDILKQENIQASFFLLGSRVELYPNIVKRAYEENHYIASHGYSHVYSKIYASPQCVLDEYNKTLVAIRNAIDEQEYNPHLFRFPGGYTGGKYSSIKKEAAELLEQNEIMHIDWNALISDSAGLNTTEQFLSELDKTVKNHQSVIVLMHDSGNKITTAEALPQIISYFRERGYEFQNFYNILN